MQAKPETQRVLIAAGLDTQDGPPHSFITLPDPKSGQPSTYLLGGSLLQEINWVKQQFSSWFIGDAVLQDGGLYVCTPVDPLLVALPLLERARGGAAQQRQREGGGSSGSSSGGADAGAGAGAGMFCDLEQILLGVQPHAAAQQLTSLLAPQLRCLCDCKAVGGQEYFRLNDDKVVAWLQHKVGQAKSALLASPPSAALSSFASMEGHALTAYAAGMLGEYLSEGWAARLCQALGIPEDAPAAPAPRPAPDMDGDAQRAEKRPKLDPKEAAKQKAAEARQAAKTAKLAKEASSMRKLSSFFAPRPAK